MESNNTAKTLVLKFEGYNPSHSFNLKKIIAEDKNKLEELGLTKTHDFIYYGEEDSEPTNTLGLIGAFCKRSPIKTGASNFVDRAFDEFKKNNYDKIICDSHSFGAHILSKVLAEMNKRYNELETYYSDQQSQQEFKRFYNAFKRLDFNQPFVRNRFAYLRGFFNKCASLFLWRNVETDQEAVKKFANTNKEVAINFLIAKNDEVINYDSQRQFHTNITSSDNRNVSCDYSAINHHDATKHYTTKLKIEFLQEKIRGNNDRINSLGHGSGSQQSSRNDNYIIDRNNSIQNHLQKEAEEQDQKLRTELSKRRCRKELRLNQISPIANYPSTTSVSRPQLFNYNKINQVVPMQI